MDKNSKEFQKEKPSNSSSNINEKDEILSKKKEDKKISSISDGIGSNKQFILSGNNLDNLNESETNQNYENKEKDFENKISIDLSDVNKKKLHFYLNEDLIDAIDKSLDDPIDQCISDLSHNENDTNYSQNNISNDNDILNNLSNINNYQFYPKNINSIHNTISFFPKINKKNEEINVNNNNNFNKNINNKDESNKDIKKLVDYFGNNNPLDAPVYIPQKFKSLKFNQKPKRIGGNEFDNKNKDKKNNIDEKNEDKKEEKHKKPFEIREGDWTCEFCYNLNFAFRKRCNRCGFGKEFRKVQNNLSMNTNEIYPEYQKLIQKNVFLGNNSNNAFQFLNHNKLSNTSLFSQNNSNYQ